MVESEWDKSSQTQDASEADGEASAVHLKLKEKNVDDDKGGFNPKWDLLVKNNVEGAGSKRNSQQDEGDVGSTRQSRPKLSKGSRGEGSVDTKRNWIKATYSGITKRLYQPPIELEELKILLWMRFGALRDNFQDPGALQVCAELPKPKDLEASAEGNEMPLTCSEDLGSFLQQTYQERRVCPRLIVKVDASTAVRKSVPRNIFRKSARNSAQNSSRVDSDRPGSLSEASDKAEDKAMCGPSDERMSWGLHFYEQQDKVNRAHFPEIYDSKDGRPTIEEGGTDEEEEQLQQNHEVVDWKYSPPERLRGKGGANDQHDLVEEDYYYEEDDPLQQQNSDIFHEQRLLEQKLAQRPERVTFQQEVDQSSQNADFGRVQTGQSESDLAARPELSQRDLLNELSEVDLVQLDDYEPEIDPALLGSKSQRIESKGGHSRRIQRKMSKIQRKRKKNTVGFKYNVKLARIPKKNDWGSWLSGMFGGKQGTSIKDLAHVEHVPEQEAIPKNEYHTTVQAGQTAFIQFKVFNHTDNDWDSGCFLINDYDGGRQENFFEISKSVTKNHMFYLEIQIFIPAIVQEQLLEVKFQFVTPRFRPFGERMSAKINIVQDAIRRADVLSSRSSIASHSGHMERQLELQESVEDTEIFQKACDLSDAGFGDFDVCLTVLTAKKGNVKLAKNALSRVIFNNQKLQASADKKK